MTVTYMKLLKFIILTHEARFEKELTKKEFAEKCGTPKF